MQEDGHLLVNNPSIDLALWKSRTAGNPTAVVKLSDDGIAEMKNNAGHLLWTNIHKEENIVDVLQSPPTAGNFPASSPANEPDSSSAAQEIELFRPEDTSDLNEFSNKNDNIFGFDDYGWKNDEIKEETTSPAEFIIEPTRPIVSKHPYIPGILTVNENGLVLSKGLTSRKIAQSGQKVTYHNGKKSSRAFHVLPDAGAAFPAPDGGFVYVTNSEDRRSNKGGVGAIRFDKNGNVVDYRMILTGTTANCGGGKTPWNTWVSCEENGSRGQIYEVDPFDNHKPVKTVMGGKGGNFESVACDNRNPSLPIFYVTNDSSNGEIRQFTPTRDAVRSGDKWDILSTPGTMKYLKFNTRNKTFTWVSSISEGRKSATDNYRNCEGIDFRDGYLYFVSKRLDNLYILDIDKGTYKIDKIGSGKFDGAPDQIKRLTSSSDKNDLLYFTEEGGNNAGIHARDHQNKYYTIVEGKKYGKETTGLAFSPDGKTLLFAHQKEGVVFAINRLDGEPFHGTSIDVKRHLAGGRRLNES